MYIHDFLQLCEQTLWSNRQRELRIMLISIMFSDFCCDQLAQ